MNRKGLAIFLILLGALAFGGYTLVTSRTSAVAGLKIVTSPTTTVYLNDRNVGNTPYEGRNPASDYTVKLIPVDTSTGATTWQGTISLSPSLLTYVRRDLGTSELTSGGELVSLEKITDGTAQISVNSTPEAATVVMDGQERGVTPFTNKELTEGEHEIAVSSTGFIGRSTRIQATRGYRVIVNFNLALSGTEMPVAQGTVTPAPGSNTSTSSLPDEPAKPYIQVKDTPTGFLRVRMGPSLSGTEAAQIKPGEKFPLLEEKSGWYKITYEEGKEGWISGRYAEKFE